MINTCTLVGRITKDLTLNATQSGNKYCQFTLAVNRRGTDEADFINCVAWNKSAENLCQYMSKGSLIGIVGRIQTRSYENKQGQRIYITEVVADSVTFLEKKQSGNQQDSYSGTSLENIPNYSMEDLPF